MASLKQVRYLRERNEGSRATVFYIDIRTSGRFEKFYDGLLDDPGVSFVKGKVAEVRESGDDGDLELDVEDTIAGAALHPRFDLVVLATGMVPSGAGNGIGDAAGQDEHGFLEATTSLEGVFAAGCARHPCDVSQATKEGTAAALRAIRHLRRGS
jgi:quinone-modifying oxidoreductase subunit QmoA